MLLLYFPLSLFSKNKNFADYCAKKWSQAVLWILKIFCRIDHKIIDIEKIPNEPCIIACKHQSMWETIAFHIVCKYPSYIYKKELLKVPFYGWYVKQMSSIAIDRNGAASALKAMIKQTKKRLGEGHNVVIFPQGTRTPVGASAKEYPYQIGVAALYMSCGVKVVPAVLNSGEFWSKGLKIKGSGCIKIKLLDPIEPGLSKEEFMQVLQDRIENSKLS